MSAGIEMNRLDSFERFFERIMEDSVGRIFRTPIQPVEIGRRLERSMESRQVVSVDGVIVPNDYTVLMNPQDMVIFSDFIPALCTQMEDWLIDLASDRGFGFVDHVNVQIIGNARIRRRNIIVRSRIVEMNDVDRDDLNSIQRTEVLRVVESTGNVPPKLLKFIGGAHAGEMYIVRRQSTTIGRALSNDIVADSAEVSRNHATIEFRAGDFWIVDHESTNGTAVNGRQIGEHKLEHGDQITLGNLTFEFLPYHTRISESEQIF